MFKEKAVTETQLLWCAQVLKLLRRLGYEDAEVKKAAAVWGARQKRKIRLKQMSQIDVLDEMEAIILKARKKGGR